MAMKSYIGKSVIFEDKTYIIYPENETDEFTICNGCAFYKASTDGIGGTCLRPSEFITACQIQLQIMSICRHGFGIFKEMQPTFTEINF